MSRQRRGSTYAAHTNILERIRQASPDLRRSEARVGAWILAQPGHAMEASLATVAKAAEVSTPTVVRFCQALGLDGFQALKIALAQSLALGGTVHDDHIEAGDSEAALAQKVFDFNISNLDRVRRHLDQDRVVEAISVLSQARRIAFYGVGASGIVALDAEQKFPLFGVPCSSYVDGHLQAMSAAILQPGDVAVAISHTGRTEEILLALELAREAGATTIALTGPNTPLADRSDLALELDTLDDTDVYTPTISRIAALVVIDVLAVGVAMRRQDDYRTQLRRLKHGLARKRIARP